MIEFKMKEFYPGHEVGDWAELNDTRTRTIIDYEFSYCNYKVNGILFTEMCPEFLDAIQKDKFWEKLRD